MNNFLKTVKSRRTNSMSKKRKIYISVALVRPQQRYTNEQKRVCIDRNLCTIQSDAIETMLRTVAEVTLWQITAMMWQLWRCVNVNHGLWILHQGTSTTCNHNTRRPMIRFETSAHFWEMSIFRPPDVAHCSKRQVPASIAQDFEFKVHANLGGM